VFPVAKAPHTPRGPVRLGRSGENDVAIPEYSISKSQCYFDFEPEGIKITDCGSTNGTIVDDKPIPPSEPVLIKDGARISLGRFAFEFRTAVGFHAAVKSMIK
jgi:pSer/pThr/pTyr-binding forkhead associated (FHA) protein